MAKQTINTGLSANDRTGDTLRTTGIKINANFTELYNILGGSNIGAGTSQLTDSGLDIIGPSARTKLGAVGSNVEVNIDLPDSSGVVLVDTAIQTMSNKTLDSAQLNNPSILNMQIFDDNSSHKYSVVAGSLTANHNLNIPSLTDSDTLVLNNNSATITNKTFEDKIYIADFFFTSCPGICPKLTKNMNSLQKAYLANDDILLLSHTVMPWKDSIPVLKQYAKTHHINNKKWHLVTGDKSEIYHIARNGYFADEDFVKTQNESNFIHTENFILVDKEGYIRGVYNGTLEVDVERLKRHVNILKAEG